MLTLDRIRDEILELMKSCETNPEQAQSGIQEIFYMLMCADQPFYLIYAGGTPLLSPASSDEKNLYLRLFTHEEVADKYVSRTGSDYKEHTLLDILQIGRWAFLRGAYGFVLNEGDRWIRISIPELLSLFFTRIYGDASLCEQSCVEAVSLINEIRRNDSYHYGMRMGEDGEWTGDVQAGLIPPLTVSSLFCIPTDTLQVEKDGARFVYSRESIQKALALCGCNPDADDPFAEDGCNDEMSLSLSFANGNWKTEDPENLALTFEPVSSQESEEPQELNAETNEDDIPVAVAVPNPPEERKGLRSFFARFFRKKPAKTSPKREDGEDILEPKTVETAPDIETESAVDPFQEPELSPEPERNPEPRSPEAVIAEPADREVSVDFDDNESISMSEETSKREKKEKRKGRKKLWLVLAAILSIVVLVSVFFAVRHLQYKENIKNFRTYIAVQDYANAYILYQDAKLGSDADEYLADEVDGLILRYANNEISAEELSASLNALSNFLSLSQELKIAKLTASKLEESKNAYVAGKESTDIYERLNTWRQVVQLDAVNYAAVQQSVEDNESRYVDVLRADIEYYRTRILEFTADRVDVLAYWYPENEYVPALVKEYSSVQAVPLSYYPVAVSDVRIRQEPNSYWTLYVKWSNLSVKTINSICFSVVAIGEDGGIVTCEDTQGEWTIFDALDRNRYEPGEEPSFAKYYWTGAFYGPNVRTVRLTAVNIEYRDGSSASYTSDIDLDSIMTL